MPTSTVTITVNYGELTTTLDVDTTATTVRTFYSSVRQWLLAQSVSETNSAVVNLILTTQGGAVWESYNAANVSDLANVYLNGGTTVNVTNYVIWTLSYGGQTASVNTLPGASVSDLYTAISTALQASPYSLSSTLAAAANLTLSLTGGALPSYPNTELLSDYTVGTVTVTLIDDGTSGTGGTSGSGSTSNRSNTILLASIAVAILAFVMYKYRFGQGGVMHRVEKLARQLGYTSLRSTM